MKRLLPILFLVCELCACGKMPRSDYPEIEHIPAALILERDQIVYIAVPESISSFEGFGRTEEYIREGEDLPGTMSIAYMMQEAFAPYASQVIIGTSYETTQEALASATELSARYVFIWNFDTFRRKGNYSWQPTRFYYSFSLWVKIFDTLCGDAAPVYHQTSTHPPLETLEEQIEALATLAFEGIKSKGFGPVYF